MIPIRHWVASLSVALLLAGCGQPDPEAPPPSPLLYELASTDGEVEGWLFGTIHALPDGAEWQTTAVKQAIDGADLLVVEVAELGETGAAAKLFAQKAAAPTEREPAERLPADLRPAFGAMLADGGQDEAGLAKLDTWALALVLAQGVRHGEPENGVDRALLKAFADRPAIELEGLAVQFDMFDRLPEREQRDLLAAVVRDHVRWADDPGHLTRAWLAGEIDALIDPAQSALLGDAELREILLTRRNAAWAPRIDGLLRAEPLVLVAVGAGHLPGPDGLAALLERRGYTLRRMT